MPSVFHGVRILDFTRFQQGPYSTVLLSDMGAEVIKVEPIGGEPGRQTGLGPDGFSAYFEAHNRGKKCITLNLKDEAARQVVYDLLPTVDVVVENFRPGFMERVGLGYEDLKSRKPDIIVASASAFGREGPWAKRPGYDHVAQALSGVMVEQGEGNRDDPQALIGGFADQIGGMMLAFGVASALYWRAVSGEGQHVSGSLIGGMVSMQAMQITRYLRTGVQVGKERRRSALYTHYRCADGRFVAIAADAQAKWLEMTRVMHLEHLAEDERFRGPFGRAKHKMELVALLEEAFATWQSEELLDALTAADVPNAPVLDYAEVAEHPQFWANGYLQEIEHATLGPMRVPGPALHMSATPPAIQGGGGQLSEFTERLLLEIGYDWDRISALRERGAI